MTGNELKQRRERLGLSQEALARKLNFSSTSTVARWEQMKSEEIPNKLLELALRYVEEHARNGDSSQGSPSAIAL